MIIFLCVLYVYVYVGEVDGCGGGGGGVLFAVWSGVSDLHPAHIISMFVPKITQSYKNRQYVNKD